MKVPYWCAVWCWHTLFQQSFNMKDRVQHDWNSAKPTPAHHRDEFLSRFLLHNALATDTASSIYWWRFNVVVNPWQSSLENIWEEMCVSNNWTPLGPDVSSLGGNVVKSVAGTFVETNGSERTGIWIDVTNIWTIQFLLYIGTVWFGSENCFRFWRANALHNGRYVWKGKHAEQNVPNHAESTGCYFKFASTCC